MEYTTLGRTGLNVSRAGLGCGGHARLGQSYGHSTEQSIKLVRTAIDLGVNFIDTAAIYGTEEIVGEAVKYCRDKIVISTKQTIFQPGSSATGQTFIDPRDLSVRVEENLKRLKTDYIDIFHLHGIMANQYEFCLSELVPELIKLREQGKVRFFGLTERFIRDTNHKMLNIALDDNIWDVVMVGFSLLNPSARHLVLKKAMANNIGTLNMFAVRRALSDKNALSEIILQLQQKGLIDWPEGTSRSLDFLTETDAATTIMEAAYRFCRHEPGIDIVLTGTGSTEHLAENIKSIQQAQLPQHILTRLHNLFGNVDSISGN